MLPVELASLVSDLAFAFFGLGMLAVAAGCWLYSTVRWLLDMFIERLWLRFHRRSPSARQGGRVDPALLAVVLVVVAVLGACTAPVPFHADSSVWYDDVKKGW